MKGVERSHFTAEGPMSTTPIRFGAGRSAAAAVLVMIALVGSVSSVAAQTAKSAAAAKELAAALDAAKLDAIAAVDPADPTVYCAALYFPGSQILVVSAKYAAP